ncbi:hypothetical protein [Arthrobacter dokdonensis]|uniref:hypothetical protein n=1 Tax=Arthrobacter dokdonellae TaxID=2211210 RepID=UPI001013CBB3|nr:hypothetical protein [Arthrobacter dokdonellae]
MTFDTPNDEQPSLINLHLESVGPEPSQLRLPFPAPYAELSTRPDAFEFQWKLLNEVFALPDPSLFSALSRPLPTEVRSAIHRYIQACRLIAGYSLLVADRSLRLRRESPSARIAMTLEMPSDEIIRGFVTLFRQLSTDDTASFGVVKNHLRDAVIAEGGATATSGRRTIKLWQSARARLLATSLQDLAQRKVLEATWPRGVPVPQPESTYTPQVLIDLFQYGEYIHWDGRRQDHAAIFQNPAAGALLELQFQSAQIGLTHLYLGFAKLAEAAVPDLID